jgi:protein-S-isoprenylcysteine O-methyltransferase Ste14
MDPINILVGLNIIATFAANLTGAKKGLKSTISDAKERPKTYLQKFPLILAAVTLLAMIIGVFQIGTLEYKEEYKSLRIAGLLIYLIFSWVQIWAYKTLGENYSQEIVMFKNHQLITKGPFKYIRHPQYLSQILMDIGGGLALLSYIALPLAVFEIPFVMMRAFIEERMLERNFKEAFIRYKNKSGFMIPFIG